MEKQTISFRLESDKVNALDALAQTRDRDRTYLLNEAVTNYLDVQQWQLEQIHKSIREADSGKVLSHDAVKKLSGQWRKRR
jgi:predicted transcriptional regulator